MSNTNRQAASFSAGEKRSQNRFPWKSLAIAVGIGVGVILLVLLLASLLMTIWDIPVELINPIASLALVLGGGLAGYLAARMVHRKGLLTGGICGCTLFVLVLAGNLPNLPEEMGPALLLKLVILVASSMAGGVLGVNKQVRGRR